MLVSSYLPLHGLWAYGRLSAWLIAHSNPVPTPRPLRGRLINSDSLLRVLLLDSKFFYKSRSSSSPLGLISFFHVSDASPNQSFQRFVPEKTRIWPDQSKQVVRASRKSNLAQSSQNPLVLPKLLRVQHGPGRTAWRQFASPASCAPLCPPSRQFCLPQRAPCRVIPSISQLKSPPLPLAGAAPTESAPSATECPPAGCRRRRRLS